VASTNLVWQQGPGFRFAPLHVPDGGRHGFTRLSPAETGITFTNRLDDATVVRNRLLEIGSGVALGDIDGDGLVDIYFCRLEGGNVLYRNLGNWRFEEITAQAGVACPDQFSTGCAFVDIDGDGDLDLLVNSLGGGTRLFLNDGKGHFTEMTESGLLRQFGATSLALADVDGDGNLDLYVTNYRTDTFWDHLPGASPKVRQAPNGTLVAEPRDRFIALPARGGQPLVLERGEPDVLYVNRGGGHFLPVPWTAGLFADEAGHTLGETPTDWGLSAMFRDLNGDGLPDLYVCNDFVYWHDRIWFNENGQRLRAAPRFAFRHVSLSSMALDVADINRDGHDAIFIADMLNPRREARAWQRPDVLKGAITAGVEDPNALLEVPRNTLQLARGDGTFAEIALLAGVGPTDWTTSALFLDVDLDGWEDLLLVTGNNHDVQDMDALRQIGRAGGWKTPESRAKAFQTFPRRPARALALRNRHDLTFEDLSTLWKFDAVGIGHGMAVADLDNDGDLDVVVNCMNEPCRIYRNDSSAPRIAVRLKGLGGNTRGIGARIKVIGGPVTQTQEMIAGGRFCSSDDPMRVFAAGQANQLQIEVTWRSGKRSFVTNATPNCIYEIDEAAATTAPETPPTAPTPLFKDISPSLNHTHHDEPFDDFARQPLLPHKLSTLGPGVTWADVNGDGYDDLIVGTGKGGRPAIFLNNGKGQFSEWGDAPVPKAAPRDETTLLLWQSAASALQLIVGESNWEDADPATLPFTSYALSSRGSTNATQTYGAPTSATGPLAMADVDGDGKLDLFIGGRAVSARYPEPATSVLLHNDGSTFTASQVFTNLGLVSAATFADLDNDGQPDLVLACEWGPIRVFHNDHGRLSATNFLVSFDSTTLHAQRSTLHDLTGWWNGIAVGDFDGDGKLDLVASNWGRNWRTDEPPGVDLPVSLFYGDFADTGAVQTLLASFDGSLGLMTPWRERSVVAAAIPSVALRAPDFHAYGRSSVQQLLGDKAATAGELKASAFDSMVFLNRGDHFEARPLPIQAQFAPAFGVSVADFDGDGNEDIFLAQNFFGVDAETSRQDAGVGLVLLGDGHGGFRALGPLESGIAIYGEQRGCAVADFNRDGRVDLAVAQHGGQTKLFQNVRANPGVRVVLHGSSENPRAIGAVLRLKCGDRVSPAHPVLLGSGYWSQDSTTVVMAAPASPSSLQIRWPGGTEQTLPWPEGRSSVEISLDSVNR
jgi:hypothetical protein